MGHTHFVTVPERAHEYLDCVDVLCLKYKRRAGVAQSVEQGTENPRVSGSIPLPGTLLCFISSRFTEYPPLIASIFKALRGVSLRITEKQSFTAYCLHIFITLSGAL
jgi:hypothetical protein